MDTSYILIGIVVLIVIIIVIRRMSAREEPASAAVNPYIARPLLTEHEFSFFEKLSDAAECIGAQAVFPQVAMAALIDVRRGLESADRRAARNRFDRKIVDFVLVDPSMRVLMIVELDDRTHDTEKRRAEDADRDSLTSRAGYRTARFRNGRRISVAEIEKELRRTMAS